VTESLAHNVCMSGPFAVGDAVQTPLGKGTVRDVQNNGRLVIQIQQRTLVVPADSVSLLAGAKRKVRAAAESATPHFERRHAPREVDLHGLRVEEALVRIDEALDAALLAGLAELRFVHGRSGGRIRGALHQRLRSISTVHGFRLDPRNPGVTIVTF
jgi:DNA mismatch repair protein MutS2